MFKLPALIPVLACLTACSTPKPVAETHQVQQKINSAASAIGQSKHTSESIGKRVDSARSISDRLAAKEVIILENWK